MLNESNLRHFGKGSIPFAESVPFGLNHNLAWDSELRICSGGVSIRFGNESSALGRRRAGSRLRDVKTLIDQDYLAVNAELSTVPTTSDRVRVRVCRIERDSDSSSVRNSSPPSDAPSPVS